MYLFKFLNEKVEFENDTRMKRELSPALTV